MTESRWANWSPGTLKTGLRTIGQFMEQAPVQAGMGTRSAADEAREAGLTHAGYGYYKDSSGQVVAQSRDGKLVYIQGDQKMQPSQVDMGNPTSQASGMTPADKARSMGLVSDGSGSYKDSQGNTIARTVNNELVFYDSRAGGGAVSDGSGGAMITQSSPSWVDPVTGLIVVPPAQPESPEEINAVPDPTPAQAPFGYDAFVTKKKKEAYEKNYVQTQIKQDIAQKQAQVDEVYASHPMMDMMRNDLNERMTGALESGDEYRIQTATRTQDLLNDNAEKYKEYYDIVPEDKHGELSDNIAKYTVQQAKLDTFEANGLTVDDLVNAPEEEYEAMMKKYGNPEKYQDAIEDMIDDAKGLKAPKVRKQNYGKGGDYVYYDIQSSYPRLVTYGEQGTVIDGNEDIEQELVASANKELEPFGFKYGREDKPNFFEVEWQLKSEDEPKGKQEKKKAALEALYTWRNKVLPGLKPGMILFNAPTSETRAKVYELAGFSPVLRDEYKDQQFAVVVNENGKNVLKPLDPTAQEMNESIHWKVQQIQENFLNMVDGPLRGIAIDEIYGGLFE